ncbi:LytR family transcriptional regulator [Deinococcus psychrotolerans]|uniref:LytR family transcriptional regulator n=1 Tax=Deinococcus psychrotolerans TaxID=2489213 RepID=A0A3G8YCM5_9DEIO|nr:LCP family protein [Deinococcus psychrotolerans]AZI43139.1 LytR family transcriptional regulator [Deinococcus psychrotolerans]
MWFRVFLLLALAGLVALISPAVPALLKYGAVPSAPVRPVNLLLAGVTPEYDETSAVWPWPAKPEAYTYLTDTIVLAQLRASGEVELLSIPRDTWVNIPSVGGSQAGYGKINAANRRGGPEVLVQAVQNLTGLPVDGYALLSLNALRDLTNASGGVDVNVPERMQYDDNAGKLHVDLQPGMQHLSGPQVEGFLRFRHDNLGDIGRVTRQQLYLQSLSQKLTSPLNVWRWPSVIGALDRNTKAGLSREVISHTLGALLSGPKINTHTLPGDFGPSGTWTANRSEIRALISKSFSDPSDPRSRSVAIANIDAPAGAARALQDKLVAAGYSNVWIVNLQRGQAPTTFIAGAAGAALSGLRADLGYGQVQAAGGAAGADLTILLGSDTPVPN